jgi:hypothetical protein
LQALPIIIYGVLTEPQIDRLGQYPELGRISALLDAALRKLVAGGWLQLSLCDERNLAEISSPGHPGERLIGCFNPLLSEERRWKRADLLRATEKELDWIAKEVARRKRTPLLGAEIALKVGKVLNRFKVAKHFLLTRQEPASGRASLPLLEGTGPADSSDSSPHGR